MNSGGRALENCSEASFSDILNCEAEFSEVAELKPRDPFGKWLNLGYKGSYRIH